MTDLAGGAEAPAAPSGVPIPADVSSQAQPLGSQTPVAEKPPVPAEAKPEPKPEKPAPEAPSKSAGDAIRKASEAVKAKTAEAPAKEKAPEPAPKAAEKPAEGKDPQPRGEGGQFASREAQQLAPERQAQPSAHKDAPSRFDDAAKADWEKAPESIKGAINRTIRELEQGHQKYRSDAEAYERLRSFDDLAKQNGGDLKASLERVKAIEDAFERNPLEGFHRVAEHFGFSLRDVAAHVMGQTPDQVQRQQDSTIAELRQQVAQLTQQITGVTGTLEKQQHNTVISEIESFAKEHPRLDDEAFASDVTMFLNSDKVPQHLSRVERLAEAYELAERLNPDTSNRAPLIPADSQARAQTPEQPRQPNPAGQKSISGGPSAGSDPAANVRPSSSNREALQRAFRRAG